MTTDGVVTVIQARTGSTRLPGKILKPLAGAPALERMLERVRSATLVGTVVVATTTLLEDALIVGLCERIQVPCIRGHRTDLLSRHLQAAAAFDARHVVKMPSDCPLIDPAVIDRTIGYYLADASRFDYVSNLHPATDPDGCDVEVCSRAALETAWREASRPFQREHTTPFLWDQPDRFRIGNVTRPDGRDLSRDYRVVLDYPEDLAVIAAVFDGLHAADPSFTIDEVVVWLDLHPDVARCNARYRGVNWYRDHLTALRTVGATDTRVLDGGLRMTASLSLPFDSLPECAHRVREHCIRMSTAGGCFLGASLSCTDLLVYLYSRFLRVDPARPLADDRDILLLSKGHDVPALYGTLAELGFFPRERLANHLAIDDAMYWHPNRSIPGVEFHSGSLGHLLGVGAGIAYDARLDGSDRRVVVVLGDGELNEGSVWETALVAAAHRLASLIAIVDRNDFQANMRTEELIPLEPLADKWRAFGWNVAEIDGHDFQQMEEYFRTAPQSGKYGGRPSVVIAHTVRGKGLPSIEARADRWFCNFSTGEVDALLRELRGGALAAITAEPLIVR